jgi:hypothetical protein
MHGFNEKRDTIDCISVNGSNTEHAKTFFWSFKLQGNCLLHKDVYTDCFDVFRIEEEKRNTPARNIRNIEHCETTVDDLLLPHPNFD